MYNVHACNNLGPITTSTNVEGQTVAAGDQVRYLCSLPHAGNIYPTMAWSLPASNFYSDTVGTKNASVMYFTASLKTVAGPDLSSFDCALRFYSAPSTGPSSVDVVYFDERLPTYVYRDSGIFAAVEVTCKLFTFHAYF